MSFVEDEVTISPPATSANLGAGFDALGLALDLHDTVSARVEGRGLVFDITGEGAKDLPHDETHLVYRSMLATFDVLGERPQGLYLTCENVIPHGRGLGSSAGAIAAGIALARSLVVGGAERLDDRTLLQLATDLEGHPDNVAAALFGGLTIAWTDGAAADFVKVPVELRPVTVFVPSEPVSTEKARGMLPEVVPFTDAAFNVGRAALMIAALTGQPERLISATEDRLHQSYRSDVMPDSYRFLRQLRAEGIPAVISGAGPTVLVFADGVADRVPDGWTVREVDIVTRGAIVD